MKSHIFDKTGRVSNPNARTLFLYTSGRQKRINPLSDNEAPNDFLYGYKYFKENGLSSDYLETNKLAWPWYNPKLRKLKRESDLFSDTLGIGIRAHLLAGKLDVLREYDNLIATTDSIALGLARLKLVKHFNGRII